MLAFRKWFSLVFDAGRLTQPSRSTLVSIRNLFSGHLSLPVAGYRAMVCTFRAAMPLHLTVSAVAGAGLKMTAHRRSRIYRTPSGSAQWLKTSGTTPSPGVWCASVDRGAHSSQLVARNHPGGNGHLGMGCDRGGRHIRHRSGTAGAGLCQVGGLGPCSPTYQGANTGTRGLLAGTRGGFPDHHSQQEAGTSAGLLRPSVRFRLPFLQQSPHLDDRVTLSALVSLT